MNLNVDRQRVKNSPAYDASTTVDRAYEKNFHKHYGEVQPSDRDRAHAKTLEGFRVYRFRFLPTTH